jgi:tRNA U34 5-carboxymethylaminomethyl modifying GTPase MnmE/TrmE
VSVDFSEQRAVRRVDCACGAQVTGDEASEQVLDEVFSRFCIGK